MKTALFWRNVDETTVCCKLCPHACRLVDGAIGRCRSRYNRQGKLYAGGYGAVSALCLDPIEKKPLARFLPGSKILSVGGYGCNLSCLFCQNHAISQVSVPEADIDRIEPSFLVDEALRSQSKGNIGLAFTYNEPLVNFEFVLDTARAIRQAGMKTVLVTNGYVNRDPMSLLLPDIDAMNIDLKAFTDSFYADICGGSLQPVLDTIELCAGRCHVEVTTLIIPGLNASEAEIEALAARIAAISADIPLHLNRHHPDFRMSEPSPVDDETLQVLADRAAHHLKHVYCGNTRPRAS